LTFDHNLGSCRLIEHLIACVNTDGWPYGPFSLQILNWTELAGNFHRVLN